jgi:hypothetical protein
MPKISVLTFIVILFLSGIATARTADQVGTIQYISKTKSYVLISNDEKGLAREFKVSNPENHGVELFRLKGKQVRFAGKFTNGKSRSGTVRIISIQGEWLDPLQINSQKMK